MTLFVYYSIEKQVKDIMHRAFWDAFQEKITEDPPDYSQAVVLIQEVKEVLPQYCKVILQQFYIARKLWKYCRQS